MSKVRPGLGVVDLTEHGIFLSQTFSYDLNMVVKDLKQATIFPFSFSYICFKG